MNNNKVQILMSTYNGSLYIRKQLDSIMNQDYPVSLFIRDDGSTDDTVSIIEEYQSRFDNISLVKGDNVGVIHSFFSMINMADKEADYYSFADQDDIWLPDKVRTAVERLSKMNNNVPCMYCSEQTLIDADDKVIEDHMRVVERRPGFGNSVVENIATGCTCVVNRRLLELAKAKPEFTIMHDWWMYMLATSMGEVVFDTKPKILYRQHGNNTMGKRTNYIDEFKKRVKRFSSNKGNLYRQLESFERLHGDNLDTTNKEILDMVLAYKKSFADRMRCITTSKIYRQRKSDNLIFKLLFFTNHI